MTLPRFTLRALLAVVTAAGVLFGLVAAFPAVFLPIVYPLAAIVIYLLLISIISVTLIAIASLPFRVFGAVKNWHNKTVD